MSPFLPPQPTTVPTPDTHGDRSPAPPLFPTVDENHRLPLHGYGRAWAIATALQQGTTPRARQDEHLVDLRGELVALATANFEHDSDSPSAIAIFDAAADAVLDGVLRGDLFQLVQARRILDELPSAYVVDEQPAMPTELLDRRALTAAQRLELAPAATVAVLRADQALSDLIRLAADGIAQSMAPGAPRVGVSLARLFESAFTSGFQQSRLLVDAQTLTLGWTSQDDQAVLDATVLADRHRRLSDLARARVIGELTVFVTAPEPGLRVLPAASAEGHFDTVTSTSSPAAAKRLEALLLARWDALAARIDATPPLEALAALAERPDDRDTVSIRQTLRAHATEVMQRWRELPRQPAVAEELQRRLSTMLEDMLAASATSATPRPGHELGTLLHDHVALLGDTLQAAPLLKRLVSGAPAQPLPITDTAPLPGLAALHPELSQHLNRTTGQVRIRTRDIVRNVPAEFEVPALAEAGSVAEQDRWLRDLDAIALTLFADDPAGAERMSRALATYPRSLSIRSGSLRAGTLTLAERGSDRSWTFDHAATAHARDLLSGTTSHRPLGSRPFDRWIAERPSTPGDPLDALLASLNDLIDDDAASAGRPGDLILLVQAQDEQVVLDVGPEFRMKYRGRLAWVQLKSDGSVAVKEGQSVLDGLDASPRGIKMIVVGHGMTSVMTKERLLAGYTAHQLSKSLKTMLAALLPGRQVGRTTLLSCALASPVAHGDFGGSFATAASADGWAAPDMTTTAYRDFVSMDRANLLPAVRLNQHYLHAPPRHRAPGTTWVYSLDESGTVRARDKYAPAGAAGNGASPSVSGDGAGPSSSRSAPPRTLSDSGSVAGRTQPATPDGLMAEILAELQGDARDLLLRDLSDLGLSPGEQARLDPRSRRPGAAPIEDVVTALRQRLVDGRGIDDGFDLVRIARFTPEGALADLAAGGLVSKGSEDRGSLDRRALMKLLNRQDEVRLMRTSAALMALSDADFERLIGPAHAQDRGRMAGGANVRHFLERARVVRRQSATLMGDVDGPMAAGVGMGAVNTVLGGFQLAQNWRGLTAPMKGLSMTQLGGVLITPLTMAVGRWLARAMPSGAGALLRMSSRALQGGVADVALSALGLAVLGLQWSQFNAGGGDRQGHEHRVLAANTAVASLLTAASLAMSGIQVAAALKGGAAAMSGTLLGSMTGAVNAAALPVALLGMALSGGVSAGLWIDEFGDHVRPARGLHDQLKQFGAGFGKVFGIDTDITRRAETESLAVRTARQREQDLAAQWDDQMSFRADLLAKGGHATFFHPVRASEVRHATFKTSDSARPFSFMLQDRHGWTGWRKLHRDLGERSVQNAVAWLGVRCMAPADSPDSAARGPQLFDLTDLEEGPVLGGDADDVFLIDADSLLASDGIQGGGGRNELVLDAGGGDVRLEPRPRPGQGSAWAVSVATTPEGSRDGPRRIVSAVESLVLRHAGSADITGDSRDERFEVQGRQARIAGGGGRNVYVIGEGNRILVTSAEDSVIWKAGTAALVELSDGASRLQLQVDVPHEAIDFRRRERTLEVSAGGTPLRLEGFFDNPGETGRTLLVRDVSGVLLSLSDPRSIDTVPRPSTALAKVLRHDAAAPETRRHLWSDEAVTVHRLPSGGGRFEARALTSMPLSFLLELPPERLRYRRDDEALVIEEIPPDDDDAAAAAFTPLSLRLPDHGRSSAGDAGAALPGRLAVWAEGAASTVLLKLPSSDAPGEGPMAHFAGPFVHDAPPGPDADRDRAGTDREAAAALADAGSAKGDARAIPFRSDAGALRHVHPETGDLHADVPGLHLIRATSLARPAPDGAFDARRIQLNGNSSLRGRVHGHSLQLTSGPDTERITVFVQDYFRHPGTILFVRPGRNRSMLLSEHPVLPKEHLAALDRRYGPGDPVLLTALQACGIDASAAEVREIARLLAALHPPLLADPPERVEAFDPAAVRAYLRIRGMAPEEAARIQSTTHAQLIRINQLLAVAERGGAAGVIAEVTAEVADGYAMSAVAPWLSPDRHGALIGDLIRRQRGWTTVKRVLLDRLSLQELTAFDTWAQGTGLPAESPAWLGAMAHFAEVLRPRAASTPRAEPHAESLLGAALRLKGRPDPAAARIARMMIAADTLDEDWVAGMLQAGVSRPEAFAALRRARISPRTVMLGNLQRHRYDGLKDRSALIRVSTEGPLGAPLPTSVSRYVARKYLQLDDAGHDVVRADERPVAGVRYDIEPGEVLFPQGPSVEEDAADLEKTAQVEREVQLGSLLHHRRRWEAAKFLARGVPQRRLLAAGLVEIVTDRVPATTVGGGRSAPAHLVDGVIEAADAYAWRQPDASSAPGDPAFVFDFDHAVAIDRVTVHLHEFNPAAFDPDRVQRGQWQVEGRDAADTWKALSAPIRFDGRRVQAVDVETQGLPYRTYRLRELTGEALFDTWVTEVEFSTVEAGKIEPPASTPDPRPPRGPARDGTTPVIQSDIARSANLLSQGIAASHDGVGVKTPPVGATVWQEARTWTTLLAA